MNVSKAMVSVCMIAYNHEKYIAQAIEGVMMQQASFPFKLVIGEDCSTDNTRKICKAYKAKYPDKIQLLLPDSNLGMTHNFISTLQACTGKYIAICEGDDYWTDSYKLQMQFDFLETHENYSVCFHRYKILEDELNQYRNDNCGFLFADCQNKGVNIYTELFLKHWITQPATMIFRRECFNVTIANQYKYFRDMHLIYHLLQRGKGYLFSFDGAVYREHSGGIHGKQSEEFQCKIGVAIAQELYKNNRTESLKENYLRNLDWAIGYFKQHKRLKKKLIGYIMDYYLTSHSFRKLAKHTLKWK